MCRQLGLSQTQSAMIEGHRFKAANIRDHTLMHAWKATPAGIDRDPGVDVDREAGNRENCHIRIHHAELGARSAIQSGSDHDRSTSKPNKGIR